MFAMRICLGLLGFLHGVGITSWLSVLAASEPVAVVMFCSLLFDDLVSVSLAITRVKSTGVLLSGAATNIIAVVMFCVIRFLESNQEGVEALGMIIADWTILPLLGPLLVNAFVLFGLDFVQRRTETTTASPCSDSGLN